MNLAQKLIVKVGSMLLVHKIKMETKYFFSIFIFLVLLSVVNADVFSVNSGGTEEIYVGSDEYIEGFFFKENTVPVVNSVILNSTYGTNLTYENLTVYYSTSDEDKNDVLTNITDWRVNGKSIAIVNFPFDTKKYFGTTRDYSTNEFNGTLGQTGHVPLWNSDCPLSGCYSFDGESDWIFVSNTFSNGGADGVSVGGWIYMKNSDANSYATFAVLGSQSATVGYHWFYINDATGIGYWQYSNGTSTRAVSRTSFVSQNVWTHVVITHNYSSGQIKFYKNGNLVGTNNQPDVPISLSNRQMRFGAYSSTSNELNGSLDEVFVFNRTLNEGEVKRIYDDNLAGKHLELIVSDETKIGETWQVAVTASDRKSDSVTVLSNELVIEDNPPENPTPLLVSVDGTNESDADLNCSAIVTDIDSDSLEVYVNWIKDGVTNFTSNYGTYSNNSLFYGILDSGNLTLGDVWECEVRVYDGNSYSDWVLSNEVEIIDITDPEVYIISPEPINYTSLNVTFNVSVVENENVSKCFYNLDDEGNVTMNELNDSYFWYLDNTLGSGYHEIWFYCNDTSNNWGSNYTNFTVLDEAAIAILLSDELLGQVKWNVISLPIDDLDAIGNNYNASTDYYINVSATNTYVDLYVRADGDLLNEALDVLGLGNETYAFSHNDSTVSNLTKYVMTTNYSLIGENLIGNSTIYMKFYLDAPNSQPAGVYLNNLQFKAVRHGESI